MMKLQLKRLIICSIFASAFIIMALRANAFMLPVVDFGSIAKLIDQIEQTKTQTKYIKAQLESLKGNQYQWSNAQALINDLGSVVSRTNGLAYNARDLDKQFRSAYPGYKPPTNYSQQYKENVNLTQNTLNGILQSIGTNAQSFQSDNARLSFLQRQSQSAQGQTQAIQAATQIASETVSQIHLLRQAVIAQSNAETTYFATQIQNEANGRAELEKVIKAGSTTVPPYGHSGHYLASPNF